MTVQTSERVREEPVRALRLHLVGPVPAHHATDAPYADERLPMSPSRSYLTGFLVPSNAPEDQRSDEASQEELDLAGDADIEGDEDREPEKAAARRVIFPSSIGLSVLVPRSATEIDATASWGDYAPEEQQSAASEPSEGQRAADNAPVPRDRVWVRTARTASVRVPVPELGAKSRALDVPGSNGLKTTRARDTRVATRLVSPLALER